MNRSALKMMKFCFHLVCGFALFALSSQHAFAKQTTAKRGPSPRSTQAPTDAEIQEEAKKYLGVRYRRAGASRKGFDCSGFVKIVYRDVFGVDLPHQSSQQSRSADFESASLDSLQTGDLVFFSTDRKTRAINHVGIYLSEGRFIHAARSQGVVISKMDDPYWRPKIVAAKRLIGRIPVEPEGTGLNVALSLSPGSAVTFRQEKRESLAFSASLFENDLSSMYITDRFQHLELGYAKALHPLVTSHLTVFRDYLVTPESRQPFRVSPMLDAPGAFESRAHVQGVRMAGGIKPTENMYIAPSLSFFDYGPVQNSDGLPQLAFGVTLDLFSSSRGWALSTGLRMPIRRYSTEFDELASDRSLNFSLSFRQQLSQRVYLSVTGDNFIKFTPNSRTAFSPSDGEDQRLGLMLHFFY